MATTKKEKAPTAPFDPVAAAAALDVLIATTPQKPKTIADEIKAQLPKITAAKAKGHSTDDIAKAMGVSTATVRKVVKEAEDAAAAAKASPSVAKPAAVASAPVAAAAKK